LIHLSEITDILPKSSEEENEFSSFTKEVEEEKEAKKKKKDTTSSVNYWAKGTGYGTSSDSNSGFSLNDYIKKNMEISKRSAKILDFVAFFIDSRNSESPTMQAIFKLITTSCLQPVLESYLRNDSLIEMARSIDLYRSIFNICRKASECEPLYPMISGEGQSFSIFSLLEQLQRIALLIDKLPGLKKEGEDKDKDAEKEKQEEEKSNEEDEKEIALDIKNTFSVVKKTAEKFKKEIEIKNLFENEFELSDDLKFFEKYK